MINISNQRRATIRAIKKLFTPHFRESGYVTRIDPNGPRFDRTNRRPVMMYAPAQPVVLRGAFKLDVIIAITEFGPMTDASGGGMSWEAYSEFPLEDLMKLRTWAERVLGQPKAKARVASAFCQTTVQPQ